MGKLPPGVEFLAWQSPRTLAPNRLPKRSRSCGSRAARTRSSTEKACAPIEYRDLGLAAATGGRLGMRHIRAVGGDFSPTGWHWHDMQAHFIYVLKGWITLRFEGVEGEVAVTAGSALSQPAGVPHNVIARLWRP